MGLLIGLVAFCIILCMLVGPEFHGTQYVAYISAHAIHAKSLTVRFDISASNRARQPRRKVAALRILALFRASSVRRSKTKRTFLISKEPSCVKTKMSRRRAEIFRAIYDSLPIFIILSSLCPAIRLDGRRGSQGTAMAHLSQSLRCFFARQELRLPRLVHCDIRTVNEMSHSLYVCHGVLDRGHSQLKCRI